MRAHKPLEKLLILNNKMTITQKVLLLGLLLCTSIVFAQNTPPPPAGPPPGLPIDGLVWLGGIIALAYGAVKKYNNSKK